MIDEDVAKTIAIVQALWPHSTLGPDPESTLTMWATMLGDATVDEVGAVLRKLAQDGREHAPPVGVIAHHVGLARQQPLPPFEEVGNAMMRAGSFLPYDPNNHYTAMDTAEAVAVLQARGVHEVICRYVAMQGLRAVLTMPWPDRHALDPGQSADHRDMARAYSARAVPDWQSDPTVGVGLERAARGAGVDPGALLTAARVSVMRSVGRVARRELPAPVEDGPMIDPADVVDLFRRDRARARAAEAAARDEVVRVAEVEREAQRAALAELETHGQESA